MTDSRDQKTWLLGLLRRLPGAGRLETASRGEVEAALRESRRALSTLLSNLPGMAYRSRNDPDWTMEYVSEGARELTGYAPEDLIDNAVVSYGSLIHPEDVEQVWTEVQAALEKDEPFLLEYRIRRADDREVWVWEKGRGIRAEDGRLLALEGFVHDVTSRKKAEESLARRERELHHAQKMEVVGRLAAGVAHDFNNVLTVIRGYGDLLREVVGRDAGLEDALDEIRRATDRAKDLTDRLLALGRRQELRFRVVDLNVVVRQAATFLKRALRDDVHVALRLADGVEPVRADPGQIEQVLLNLAINAQDAMPQGGTLTIQTSNVRLDTEYAERRAVLDPGRYVQLAVSDEGHGMDRETLERVFEPFFTTKERGKGTGLGLSTVYGVVRQSGGHVWAYSEPGAGTTFKIYLPVYPGAMRRPEEPEAPDSAGREEAGLVTAETGPLVLLVEDEASLRTLMSRALGEEGFRVIGVGSAEEALRDYDVAGADVVVTDATLPGRGGRSLAEELAGRGGPPVVLISGYTSEAVAPDGLPPGVEAFLSKPFSPLDLVRAVRTVLDGR